jgi:hypothetical protein
MPNALCSLAFDKELELARFALFPGRNVYASQLSISRGQRRLCPGPAQFSSGLLTLFTRHGAVLTRSRQTFSQGPEMAPPLPARDAEYITTYIFNHIGRDGDSNQEVVFVPLCILPAGYVF